MEGGVGLSPVDGERKGQLSADFKRLQAITSHVHLNYPVAIVGDAQLLFSVNVFARATSLVLRVVKCPRLTDHPPNGKIVEIHLVEVLLTDSRAEAVNISLSEGLIADNFPTLLIAHSKEDVESAAAKFVTPESFPYANTTLFLVGLVPFLWVAEGESIIGVILMRIRIGANLVQEQLNALPGFILMGREISNTAQRKGEE